MIISIYRVICKVFIIYRLPVSNFEVKKQCIRVRLWFSQKNKTKKSLSVLFNYAFIHLNENFKNS